MPKPLRLWPGVAVAALMAAAYLTPLVSPDNAVIGLLVPVAGTALILVWWLFFSRARWYERIGALVLLVLATIATRYLVHESIAGAGMEMIAYFIVPPTLALALVGWASVSRRLGPSGRAAAAVAAMVLGCLPWTLLRLGGINNSGKIDFHWRWTPTPEQRLLAQDEEPKAPPVATPAPAPAPSPAATPSPDAAPAAAAAPPPIVKTRPAEWPGFRGPNRDDIVHGVQVATDWSASPPVQLWKRGVGPGWSSFAVDGDRFYTQEQRGTDEVVSCYRVSTGAPIWRHRDATRFWEANAGAGPRGTPTLSDGRVYSLGATGMVNVLDASTGAVIWSHNAVTDTHVNVPEWGISSSPVVTDDVVVVATGGKLAAYDLLTGKLKWTGGGGGFSYSSPHLATIDGVEQVLFISGPGTTSFDPATGKVLWEHKWAGGAIVQPALTPDGGVLVNTLAGASGGIGLKRLSVVHHGGKWTADERWTTNGLKPYFNDFVVHKGHAYGFDGNIMSAIDLQDGQRKWKGGRYGNGQLLLLADEDLLLVISEEGDLVLVKAAPDQFTEVTKFTGALEGKTWNHPVVVGDVLLARNDHEMAAFRLPRAVATSVATSGR